MRKAVLGLVIAGMVASGCTGSFQLTRKVYNFHRSQTDKWMDEVLFLVVALLPVYGLASLADAVVFNSIEFWTGKNPVVTTSDAGLKRVVKDGQQEMTMAYNPETDRIAVTSPDGRAQFLLERSDEGVVARDASGKVLLTSAATADGGIAVYDAHARLVKQYSADDLQSLKARAATN